MNTQIVRLYAVILLLFTGLVIFTSRWSVLEADELESRPENRRLLIQEQQIERGSITTSDGVLIAESLPAGGAGGNPNQRVFVRSYPQGSLFGNPVGYSFVEVGADGHRALGERPPLRRPERVRDPDRPALRLVP